MSDWKKSIEWDNGTPVYAAKPGHVKFPGWNINKGRTWYPALGQYPPWYKISGGKIRTCKVWKTNIGRYKFLNLYWRWKCRLCNFQGSLPTWQIAYATADHHARNHHGDKP